MFATEAALEVIGALGIVRGKDFVIPVRSKEMTAEERLRLKRSNRKISQKYRVCFNMLVQSMGANAVYQNVISPNCKIGDLRGAWNSIWEKYDCKKPTMQNFQTVYICRMKRLSSLLMHNGYVFSEMLEV